MQDTARLHALEWPLVSYNDSMLTSLPTVVVEDWAANFTHYVRWLRRQVPEVGACGERRTMGPWPVAAGVPGGRAGGGTLFHVHALTAPVDKPYCVLLGARVPSASALTVTPTPTAMPLCP